MDGQTDISPKGRFIILSVIFEDRRIERVGEMQISVV
jgi:hypothetical protein